MSQSFWFIEFKKVLPMVMEGKAQNEVGYYIFDYMPKDELIVRKRVEYIRQKHEDSPDGFKVVVFDLYDITIEILKEKGYLEKCFDLEKNKGLDRVIRAVGNTLRLTGDDNLIVKYIQERTPEKSVVFIIGIGKCYPLIRWLQDSCQLKDSFQ